jgi:cytochrome P450
MSEAAVGTVARSLFASDLGAAAAAAISRCLAPMIRGWMVRTVMPGFWEKLPTPGNLAFTRAVRDMRSAIEHAISAYRASGADYEDLLSMLLMARSEDGRPMTDAQVGDQVLNVVVAGIETTGAALSWAMYEIARDVRTAERVYAEVDDVLGGRAPTHDDLPQLGHLGRVIKETLRMYPPWLVTRSALDEVRLGDVVLPAGAEVIYSPYALQHDARWFPEPFTFDPDRWLRTDDPVARHANIPFGAGSHRCIGEGFAIAEMTLALAVICTRWRLCPVPGFRAREVAVATVRPHKLPMTVRPRGVAADNGSARHENRTEISR